MIQGSDKFLIPQWGDNRRIAGEFQKYLYREMQGVVVFPKLGGKENKR